MIGNIIWGILLIAFLVMQYFSLMRKKKKLPTEPVIRLIDTAIYVGLIFTTFIFFSKIKIIVFIIVYVTQVIFATRLVVKASKTVLDKKKKEK